jgi:hypothetical protein
MSNAIEYSVVKAARNNPTITRSFGLPNLKSAKDFNPRRERVEQFISTVFQAGYQAKVMTYAPQLLYLESGRRIHAALGLRSAAEHPLFCEAYLASELLSTINEPGLSRDQVFELSNLASMNPGSGSHLYVLAAIALDMCGCRKLVFTANKVVRNSIAKGGFGARFLANADIERVANGADQWGTYYDGEPQVMVADIPESAAIIRANPQMMALVNLAQTDLTCITSDWTGRLQ